MAIATGNAAGGFSFGDCRTMPAVYSEASEAMAGKSAGRVRTEIAIQTMLYFAYGSNMSSRRLRAADRVPSAQLIGRARLSRYALRWTKVSIDRSGKCHIEATDSDDDCVWGVLFKVPERELCQLDRVEGRGHGYERTEVTVEAANGPLAAMTYYATKIDPTLKPTGKYKQYVLEGAEEHGLPPEYIETLRLAEVIE